MARKKSDHNATAFAVPPTPAGATTSSVMTDLPNPFPRLPVVETEVKVEDQPCAMCFQQEGLLFPNDSFWRRECATSMTFLFLHPKMGPCVAGEQCVDGIRHTGVGSMIFLT